MRVPIWVIDAFTSRRFSGNPAGVCVLERWIEEPVLQSIAAENNLAETAFLVARGPGEYELRWFTPEVEIDLCGHATLASAHVLLTHGDRDRGRSALAFSTKSGVLRVTREGELYTLSFPRRAPVPRPVPEALFEAMGARARETLFARDVVFVLESERELRALAPDLARVKSLVEHGVIATAPGDSADYVLRFFAPSVGVPEDPVTGSVQCALAPYWSARLGKSALRALQLSKRGGELFVEDRPQEDAVRISGRAVDYLQGSIEI